VAYFCQTLCARLLCRRVLHTLRASLLLTWISLEQVLASLDLGHLDYETLREDAGGMWGDHGVAGWMVDRIGDAEPGCTRSFMHRYDAATGLLREALGNGDQAAVALFVWLRCVGSFGQPREKTRWGGGHRALSLSHTHTSELPTAFLLKCSFHVLRFYI